MGRVWDFLFVIWPILTAVCCLSVAFLPKDVLYKSIRIGVSITPFDISLAPPLSVKVTRIVLLVVALFFLLLPAFRDYSSLFPKLLTMSVYFDHDGITKTMRSFPEDDIARLNIQDDWKTANRQYFDKVNNVLRREGFSFQFGTGKGRIQSNGWTTFEVEMVDRWGLQTYEVKESHGSLTHHLDEPGTESLKEFASIFELRPTEARFIHATIRDVYVRYQIMLSPEFRQIFFKVSGERIYAHVLTAATMVRVFPYVDIGNTLYLISQDGTQVPIGYAIYK